MRTPTPPAKVRHLRLVPKLLDEPQVAQDSRPVLPIDAQDVLPGLVLPLQPSWARLGRAATALVGLALAAWGGHFWRGGAAQDRLASSVGPALPGTPTGPSFAAYARTGEGVSLGRRLCEGDTLGPHDHLVLSIHNAPGPGAEAAQYAAVFAMDAAEHVATLYPAHAEATEAMPLPQVAAMALLDGPQLSHAQGPITVVTLFLRAPVALAAAREALTAAARNSGLGGQEAAMAQLGDTVLGLQRLTLHSLDAARAPGPP